MKDRTAVNHKIRKHFNELIYNVARYTEVVLSIVILVVIALAGLRLILTTAGTSVMDMDTSFFTSFLSQPIRDMKVKKVIPIFGKPDRRLI